MDRLRAMEVFARIADAGSLTGAAESLGTSPAAVVRALAAYEKHLGVRLFQRTTRRIALTQEGREHLERVRQLLTAAEEAESALREGAAQPVGHLQITAPVLFGQMHVAPLVTEFVRTYPQLRCTLLLLDRPVNLLEEGIDLGVRIGHLKDSSLVAQKVAETRRVIVASPAYLRTFGVPRHPEDLLRANCVRVLSQGAGWGEFSENGRTFRVPVSGNLAFNQIGPAVQACTEGAGFGMFFSYQISALLARKKLRVVLDEFETPPRPISLVFPSARLVPARARVFMAFVRDKLAAQRRAF